MLRLHAPLVILVLIASHETVLPNTVGCGGNAYSHAEVVRERRGKPLRGPLVAAPDTLCGDLIETRPREIDSLNIYVDPRSQPEGGGRRFPSGVR